MVEISLCPLLSYTKGQLIFQILFVKTEIFSQGSSNIPPQKHGNLNTWLCQSITAKTTEQKNQT